MREAHHTTVRTFAASGSTTPPENSGLSRVNPTARRPSASSVDMTAVPRNPAAPTTATSYTWGSLMSLTVDKPMTPNSSRPSLLILASTYPARVGDGTPSFVRDLAVGLAARFEPFVLIPAVPGGAAGGARRRHPRASLPLLPPTLGGPRGGRDSRERPFTQVQAPSGALLHGGAVVRGAQGGAARAPRRAACALDHSARHRGSLRRPPGTARRHHARRRPLRAGRPRVARAQAQRAAPRPRRHRHERGHARARHRPGGRPRHHVRDAHGCAGRTIRRCRGGAPLASGRRPCTAPRRGQARREEGLPAVALEALASD